MDSRSRSTAEANQHRIVSLPPSDAAQGLLAPRSHDAIRSSSRPDGESTGASSSAGGVDRAARSGTQGGRTVTEVLEAATDYVLHLGRQRRERLLVALKELRLEEES